VRSEASFPPPQQHDYPDRLLASRFAFIVHE
jgi:hypothetical protein